jgi:hypothetical protein
LIVDSTDYFEYFNLSESSCSVLSTASTSISPSASSCYCCCPSVTPTNSINPQPYQSPVQPRVQQRRLLQLNLISSRYSFLCGLLAGSDHFWIDLCLAIPLLIGLLNICALPAFSVPVMASWDILLECTSEELSG